MQICGTVIFNESNLMSPVTALTKFKQKIHQDRNSELFEEFPETMGELMERAAENFPDSPAFNFFHDGITLTFSEVRDQVRATADTLSQQGVGLNSHIGVIMGNRVEFPITWLSLALLGAVMVPIHKKSTAREIEFIINDADVDFMIVESEFFDEMEMAIAKSDRIRLDQVMVLGPVENRMVLDYNSIVGAGDPNFSLTTKFGSDQLLNIQYTSGSTGTPKGAMLSHRYWIICGGRVQAHWGEMNSILSDHPFFYMDPQWKVSAALHGGAQIHFSNRMSVKTFMDWIHDYKVEVAYLPEPLLKLPEMPEDKKTNVKVFIAYAFSREQIIEAEKRYNTKVREEFGMTEIGSGLVVPYEVLDNKIFGTCGLPAVLRECKILDGSGNEVPDGVPGELWVSGDGIFKGYYNRPEQNKECLVDGWFKTGDVFAITEEGYYKYIGRNKDMIKRSGENISAYEVEVTLRELHQLEEVAVLAVPDEKRDEEVKAYIQLRPGFTAGDLPPEMIIKYCKGRLSSFKIPRYFEYIEELPYTPSAKVAKANLKAMKSDLRSGSFDAVENVWR
jgi:acyl-CoA synthetase (AMP-forming)/AMP-acid ligase II